MLIGIQNTWPNKKDLISDVYRDILKANNIDFVDLDCSDINFWSDLSSIDAFIFRWANSDYHNQLALTILPIIEKEYKIPCFPNMATCWHYDDKIRQSLLLKANNFPICDFTVFWERQNALRWIKKAELPLVFKLKAGSGSMQIKLIKTRSEAEKYINKMFLSGISADYYGLFNSLKTFNYNFLKTARYWAVRFRNRYMSPNYTPYWFKQRNYVYFQKFMPDNPYDTRVQITGNRAYAFIRYNRPNDFRASGSNNWSIDHEKIDMDFVKIAFEISKKFGFQSMAYDFIYDKDRKPVIGEISYCFGDYPEFSTGYWNEDLKWHEGHFLPQYFELVDLLNKPDLILPENLSSVSSYRTVKV